MGKLKEILYSTASDNDGNLVNAEDAPKGYKYYCTECKGEFILKKSEKRIKRAHFAHKIPAENCTPEKTLHNLFQRQLFDIISKRLSLDLPLSIKWQCSHCEEAHEGNLLKRINDVKLEYDLKDCKPDIALLDAENGIHSVIEIVVTHQPEDNALQYFRENSIILIKIILTSDEDMKRLLQSPIYLDEIDICLNQKCNRCGKYMHKSYLHIIDGYCWKCHAEMKVAIKGSIHNLIHGPAKFTDKEINIARQHGVSITQKYSDTVKRRYLANTCLKCNGFAGEFYLGPNYFMPAVAGDYEREMIELGYNCIHCLYCGE